MSYWILIGAVIGIAVATTALLVGFFVVPPIIIQQITEVNQTRRDRVRGNFIRCLFKYLTFFRLAKQVIVRVLHKTALTIPERIQKIADE